MRRMQKLPCTRAFQACIAFMTAAAERPDVVTHDELVGFLDGPAWSLSRWCATYDSEAVRMRYAELLTCAPLARTIAAAATVITFVRAARYLWSNHPGFAPDPPTAVRASLNACVSMVLSACAGFLYYSN